MAEASRFPHLVPPFAIVGAAGGWLSASFVANPLVQDTNAKPIRVAPLVAMVAAALAGAMITRLCVGRRYWYELVDPDPGATARGDRWPFHFIAVLVAGAVSGAAVEAICHSYGGVAISAFGGSLCAFAFLPVCAAVILAARRAMRARLGSIVAGSDRRAVWGILATALAVATIEVLLSWPAAAAGRVPSPWPASLILAGTALTLLIVLLADVRALRLASLAITPDMAPREPSQSAEDSGVPGVDLGLGDAIAARLSRGRAAYRDRDRALALVRGDPGQALAALRRAIGRGAIGLAVIGAVAALHAAAGTDRVQALFDARQCEHYDAAACARLADDYSATDSEISLAYHMKACENLWGPSCLKLAGHYELDATGEAAEELALNYYERACEAGVPSSCRRAKEYRSLMPTARRRVKGSP